MESQAKELSEQEQYRRFSQRFWRLSPGFHGRGHSAISRARLVLGLVRSHGLTRDEGIQDTEEIAALVYTEDLRGSVRPLWEAGYRWSPRFRVDDEGAEKVLDDTLEWLWGFPEPKVLHREDGLPGGYYPDLRLVAAEGVRRRFLCRSTKEEHASTKFIQLLLNDIVTEDIVSDMEWRLWNGSGQESLALYQDVINMLLDGVREVTKDRPRTETRLDALTRTLKAPGSASKADGVDESL